jgi:hypothetical protein
MPRLAVGGIGMASPSDSLDCRTMALRNVARFFV